ncbi:hypothetical protein EMQ25_05730 [Arsenicitalea aurantiaca]|uniref:Uncharacterized protein n=1 Tax=Arsenicitalea aurantiaca TaxID=1783274 RepID=A0A433XEX1_9HYPH|nr:hypothetical protein [Arsenicitalea aurantiaca]RUT32645.1 hypothetical protein EMQ25_05730 [Arsenicitalea aurantiaca]
MTASNLRIEREHDDRMSLAWHIAALPRGKKFPELKKLLIGQKRHRPQRQSWEAQAAILAAW